MVRWNLSQSQTSRATKMAIWEQLLSLPESSGTCSTKIAGHHHTTAEGPRLAKEIEALLHRRSSVAVRHPGESQCRTYIICPASLQERCCRTRRKKKRDGLRLAGQSIDCSVMRYISFVALCYHISSAVDATTESSQGSGLVNILASCTMGITHHAKCNRSTSTIPPVLPVLASTAKEMGS